MMRGSGVDLELFSFFEESNEVPRVVFAARLLIDKGVEVFMEAVRLLKKKNINADFWLVGDIDNTSANSISSDQLNAWKNENIVTVFGLRHDIHSIFSQANIVVFPSFYGEGLPKILLEASSCGRAIITTDHPGCRDAIIPGKTGLLVPIRDYISLAESIEFLVENPKERVEMGLAGRSLAENEFSDDKIAADHLDVFRGLLLQKN
jgi:glycosyltransferase involved in cell wall biosynthesis